MNQATILRLNLRQRNLTTELSHIKLINLHKISNLTNSPQTLSMHKQKNKINRSENHLNLETA